MKLKTKLKLNELKRKLVDLWYAAMKPLARASEKHDERRWDKFISKVANMTEDEIIERLAKTIIKELTRYPKGYEDIHIAKQTDDWADRNIRSHMIDCPGRDKYLRQYGYSLKYDDIDTCRRLTEMLYERLFKEDVLDVRWEVYDNVSYSWKGYEKTLVVEVKKEYINK